MRIVSFHQEAFEQYSDWAKTDKKLFERLHRLIMDKLSFLNFIRHPILYWVILQLVQYLYKFGFHFVSPDWKFIESAITQLIVLIAIYLANFATSNKPEK